MLALCPERCLLHHKSIDNAHKILFLVTGGNVKFAVSQRLIFHPFNYLSETRLYRGNAIIQILYSRLKKNYWRQQNLSRENSIWFQSELYYCPKIVAGRSDANQQASLA